MKGLWLILIMFTTQACAEHVRLASFNVSMEATNYVEAGKELTGNELANALASGNHPQISNIAEIIQRVRPDIILLNEFDYIADPQKSVHAFKRNYLQKSQRGLNPIDYPYYFYAPVNTGVDSGVDLDRDGVASGKGGDAFGFGMYPGQYGMLLLSRFPINEEKVRTFQHFLWRDMPAGLIDDILDEEGKAWYSDEAKKVFRLSSKSHWDVPVMIDGKPLHILASHPTPPVFDGPEDRNGKRNHDEIRFWVDYIKGDMTSQYIYDDQGNYGGFKGQRFAIMGDLNSSVTEGDSIKTAITDLVQNERVNQVQATSIGGKEHTPDNPLGATHTAAWRMQADYVLTSVKGLEVIEAGVFWPEKSSALYRLIEDRNASSDHRLVWQDVRLTKL